MKYRWLTLTLFMAFLHLLVVLPILGAGKLWFDYIDNNCIQGEQIPACMVRKLEENNLL